MYADFAQKIEEWMEKLALPDEIKVGEAGPNLSKKDVLEKSNKLKLLGSNYFSVFYLLLIILLWAIVYVPVLTQGID
jgi:cytoskeletal protein RodZ